MPCSRAAVNVEHTVKNAKTEIIGHLPLMMVKYTYYGQHYNYYYDWVELYIMVHLFKNGGICEMYTLYNYVVCDEIVHGGPID